MRNCMAVFGLALIIALFTVGIADGDSSQASHAFPLSGVFVGCRPSVQDCVSSCPRRRATWETNAVRCTDRQDESATVSCRCLYEGNGVVETNYVLRP